MSVAVQSTPWQHQIVSTSAISTPSNMNMGMGVQQPMEKSVAIPRMPSPPQPAPRFKEYRYHVYQPKPQTSSSASRPARANAKIKQQGQQPHTTRKFFVYKQGGSTIQTPQPEIPYPMAPLHPVAPAPPQQLKNTPPVMSTHTPPALEQKPQVAVSQQQRQQAYPKQAAPLATNHARKAPHSSGGVKGAKGKSAQAPANSSCPKQKKNAKLPPAAPPAPTWVNESKPETVPNQSFSRKNSVDVMATNQIPPSAAPLATNQITPLGPMMGYGFADATTPPFTPFPSALPYCQAAPTPVQSPGVPSAGNPLSSVYTSLVASILYPPHAATTAAQSLLPQSIVPAVSALPYMGGMSTGMTPPPAPVTGGLGGVGVGMRGVGVGGVGYGGVVGVGEEEDKVLEDSCDLEFTAPIPERLQIAPAAEMTPTSCTTTDGWFSGSPTTPTTPNGPMTPSSVEETGVVLSCAETGFAWTCTAVEGSVEGMEPVQETPEDDDIMRYMNESTIDEIVCA